MSFISSAKNLCRRAIVFLSVAPIAACATPDIEALSAQNRFLERIALANCRDAIAQAKGTVDTLITRKDIASANPTGRNISLMLQAERIAREAAGLAERTCAPFTGRQLKDKDFAP